MKELETEQSCHQNSPSIGCDRHSPAPTPPTFQMCACVRTREAGQRLPVSHAPSQALTRARRPGQTPVNTKGFLPLFDKKVGVGGKVRASCSLELPARMRWKNTWTDNVGTR